MATGNPLVEYNLGAYKPVLLLPQNTHWFTRTDLASGTSDISKLKEGIWFYALKTPASADLFHIWVYDKLGIKRRGLSRALLERGLPSISAW